MSDIQQSEIHKIVVGAMKGAIAAHGPITKDLVGSASKRVTAAVLAHIMDGDSNRGTKQP
jgi:hypothetical protein